MSMLSNVARSPAGLLFLLLTPASGGCAWRTPESAERAAPAPSSLAIDWPPRRTHDLDALAAATPSSLWSPKQVSVQLPDGTREARTVRDEIYRIADVRPAGVGLVRRLERVATKPLEAGVTEFEFVSYPPGDAPAVEVVGDGEVVLFQRIFSNEEITVSPPASVAAEARGLVVLLEPLLDTDYEDALVDRLRTEGWWILRAGVVGLSARGLDLTIDRPEDVDAAARAIARHTDESLAERIYAVEAVLAYLRETRPDVPVDPVVICGLSAGTFALPGISTRCAGVIDAAIFVAGGANLLDIGRRSSLSDGGIDITWATEQLEEESSGALNDAYLRHVRLDPFVTAPVLTGLPVLQLHGWWHDILEWIEGALADQPVR